jgi:hypothetical protein
MATDTKYQDQNWPTGSPIAGERLSANGFYTGNKLGTPTQGEGELENNADSYLVEHSIIRQGTILGDAADSNFPARAWMVRYDLNGAAGTIPPAQKYEGAALTVAAAPTITQYPENMTVFDGWNTAANGSGTACAAGGSFTPTADVVFYAQYGEA